jgi:hypothetical protein
MTSTKVKRSQFATFLNTGTPGTPTWSRIGDGVTAASINYNPKTTEEQYIHQDNATVNLDSYAPVLPIEASALNGDPVFEFVDNLRRTRAVGSAADSEILLVYLYETPVSTDQYPAEKQAVSISIDSFGGEAGVTAKINFTLNFRGDPTTGLYDVGSNSFA